MKFLSKLTLSLLLVISGLNLSLGAESINLKQENSILPDLQANIGKNSSTNLSKLLETQERANNFNFSNNQALSRKLSSNPQKSSNNGSEVPNFLKEVITHEEWETIKPILEASWHVAKLGIMTYLTIYHVTPALGALGSSFNTLFTSPYFGAVALKAMDSTTAQLIKLILINATTILAKNLAQIGKTFSYATLVVLVTGYIQRKF